MSIKLHEDDAMDDNKRTIRTPSGVDFEIFKETDHFIMCRTPSVMKTPADSIEDIEFMACQGYFFCSSMPGAVLFEKRK